MHTTRTRFLVAIAVAAMLIELFPGHADIIKWAAIALAVTYLVIQALRTYPKQRREKKRRAALLAADEREYGEYERELGEIRAKHDPDGGLIGPQAVTDDYQAALAALHDRHRAMLERKFGRR